MQKKLALTQPESSGIEAARLQKRQVGVKEKEGLTSEENGCEGRCLPDGKRDWVWEGEVGKVKDPKLLECRSGRQAR